MFTSINCLQSENAPFFIDIILGNNNDVNGVY